MLPADSFRYFVPRALLLEISWAASRLILVFSCLLKLAKKYLLALDFAPNKASSLEYGEFDQLPLPTD